MRRDSGIVYLVLEAAFWGLVGGGALIVGALAGIYLPASHRVVGLIMAFGVGVLFSAVAFELTAEAFDRAGSDAVVFGLLAGSLTFFAGDWYIDARGGARRKNMKGMQASAAPVALVLGALLDGIPESAAIGVSMLEGEGVGVAFLVAVFISNVPESLAASAGLVASGWSRARIIGLWALITVAAGVAAAVGYGTLGDAGPTAVAFIQAFAAGAILTMLADTMVPEAVEFAGRWVGLLSSLGFCLAFLLSTA